MKHAFVFVMILWCFSEGRTQTVVSASGDSKIVPFGHILREHGYTTTHESLVEALRSSVPAVRSDASAVLARKKDAEAVRLIEEAIFSEHDEYTAVLMAGVLMTLKSEVGRGVLIRFCAEPSSPPVVRDRSTFELSVRGEGAQCTDALLRAVNADPTSCSADCISNLARLYVTSTTQQKVDITKLVESRLQSSSMEDRAAAARALKQIDTTEAENLIRTAYVTEHDPTVRAVMQQSLELFQDERPASQK